MKAGEARLQVIFNSPNQYVIPVFQRYYVWRPENWGQLWEDFIDLLEEEGTGRTHFMGSLVFVAERHYPDKVPTYQVIDGQQRLLTLSLMFCALRNIARANGEERLAQEIEQTMLVHPFRQGREHYRVFPRQRDRDEYVAAVTNSCSPHGQVGTVLGYFTNQIQGLPDWGSESGLRRLYSTLHSRLEFVQITLEGENPYRIFKTLNSTGVDLEEGDLIRNFVFMHEPVDRQDEFDDQYWKPLERRFEDSSSHLDSRALSAFFRNFLMKEGTYVPLATTYQHFESKYGGTQVNARDVAQDLGAHADDYDIIRRVARHRNPSAEDALMKLGQLDSSTTFPLLLNLLARVRAGTMTEQHLVRSVELLSGFILRRYICGENSRPYGRWFATACRELVDAPLENLERFLISKGFPQDGRFKEAFVRFPLYGSNYARAILEAIERHHGHREPADLSQTQIEHIMPQTLSPEWREDLGPATEETHARWLHSIGNLTLSAYNPELYNKRFSIKREEYQRSNVVMTRRVAMSSRWGAEEIEARGGAVAEVAAKIWVGPEQ
jgi:hypothetical protein